jgi:hypothetical protein
LFARFYDASADVLGDGGIDGIAKGSNSLHLLGKPMNASANSGCGRPPMTSFSIGP